MRRYGIAGLQLELGHGHNHLEHLEKRLGHLMAAFPWVSMVVFSELAAHGAHPEFAQPLPGPSEATFQEMASRHRLWLLTGSMYEREGASIFNTCSVINPEGGVVARYRKMFPFAPFADAINPGTEFLVFDVPNVGRFGVSICYDMWFPETTRTLVSMGAEVILHPVMTGTTDRPVELAIARATAAMNQCFVVDINGVGSGGVGQSLIVGPEGDIIYQAGPNEELIPVEIDLDRVTATRERGLLGLGQPLKSFRAAPVRVDVYEPGSKTREYLSTLGPLEKPKRADGHPGFERKSK